MEERRAAEAMASAARALGSSLHRESSRVPVKGPHELREFAPSLKATMVSALVEAELVDAQVVTGFRLSIADWNRGKSEVDLVVLEEDRVEIVVELKVWDIGHQLFDLAKLCCLLSAGASTAFLLCIARRSVDFDRMPGGELFPTEPGERRCFDFEGLIEAHLSEWHRHVGHEGPEPTAVPRQVATIAITAPIPIDSYPGHELRACEVEVLDSTRLPLTRGLPGGLA